MSEEMGKILQEIDSHATGLSTAIESWEIYHTSDMRMLAQRCADLARSSSGSWLGYQASMYYGRFDVPPRGIEFDHTGMHNDDWREYSYDEFREQALNQASVTRTDFERTIEDSQRLRRTLESLRGEILSCVEVAESLAGSDGRVEELRTRIAERASLTQQEYVERNAPRSQLVFRDSRAMQGGRRIPHHVNFEGLLQEIGSPVIEAEIVLEATRSLTAHFRRRELVTSARTKGSQGDRIFIGHGRSAVWLELKDFLKTKLGLEVVDFNSESPAGVPTQERLAELLDESRFAFLVMTADDQHADTTKHARENVVHEVGLFQGRLGFRRAIVLLEDDCQEFSNITGLGQIRFPRGRIKAAFEEVREVLQRESIV